jgi:hypothetical protein
VLLALFSFLFLCGAIIIIIILLKLRRLLVVVVDVVAVTLKVYLISSSFSVSA